MLNQSSSCRFRIPENSGRVIWQVTNLCNYSCSYCIFSSGPRRIPGELDFEQIQQALNEMHQLGFPAVKFTGGEPFVRSDMLRILEEAGSLGITWDISTNASLISAKLARRLQAASPDMVHVSLDGATFETHDMVRGDGTFKKTLRGTAHLLNAGVNVRVGCALYRGNEYHLNTILQFCAELGVSGVVFSIMEPAGRLAENSSLLSTRSREDLLRELVQLKRQYAGRIAVSSNFDIETHPDKDCSCPGGQRFLYIDNLGRVSPCTWLSLRFPGLQGNLSLRSHSLREILLRPPISTWNEHCSRCLAQGMSGCPLSWNKILSEELRVA